MDLCLIGKIVGVHGIAGMLKVHSYSDHPHRFQQLTQLLLGESAETAATYEVETASEHGHHILLKLGGIASRTEAENKRGMLLFIQEEDMLPPPEGTYYIHDLIGCEVRSESSGKVLGTLKDVLDGGANDLYAIERNGEEYLVPVIPEFVIRIDADTKTVYIREIPGLLDDDADTA